MALELGGEGWLVFERRDVGIRVSVVLYKLCRKKHIVYVEKIKNRVFIWQKKDKKNHLAYTVHKER